MKNEQQLLGLKKHSREINKIVVESLQQALIHFVQKKPYEKISITELCLKAGVSRMGFYGNFKSKDDVFRKVVIDMHMDMVKYTGSPFRPKPNKEWYLKFFTYTKEHSELLKLFFDAGFQDMYLSFVNDLVLANKILSNEQKYQRLLYSGALVNIVVYWIKTGQQETPEELAEYCENKTNF